MDEEPQFNLPKRITVPDVEKLMGQRQEEKSKANVSELHEFILTARKEFNETAKKGDGSFSFYLGILKRVPVSTLYQFLGESKGADKPTNNFWWRVGNYLHEQKKKKTENVGGTQNS